MDVMRGRIEAHCSSRAALIGTEDGRRFYAKNAACPKRQGTRNTTWLANEIIYYEFAIASQVRVPGALLLKCDADTWFASEYLPGRTALERLSGDIAESNLIPLIKVLCLDIALLNSDRQPWNMLLDVDGLLWFVDHDKCLLGDGLPPHPAGGDLARISDPALAFWKVRDYLACSEANGAVWCQANADPLRTAFDSLALTRDQLRIACSAVPTDWLSEDLRDALMRFLPRWWELLHQQFGDPQFVARVCALLGTA